MTDQKRDWTTHGNVGVVLRFIVPESSKHRGEIMHDWLLLAAKKIGVHGGSAFHGIAGFGRQGVLREEHFFELAGDLPVEISLICTEEQAYRLLDMVEDAELSLFYSMSPSQYGITGKDRPDRPKAPAHVG